MVMAPPFSGVHVVNDYVQTKFEHAVKNRTGRTSAQSTVNVPETHSKSSISVVGEVIISHKTRQHYVLFKGSSGDRNKKPARHFPTAAGFSPLLSGKD